jgi:hypothetical protein
VVAFGFFDNDVQAVYTCKMACCVTPKIIEYIRAVSIAGNPPPVSDISTTAPAELPPSPPKGKGSKISSHSKMKRSIKESSPVTQPLPLPEQPLNESSCSESLSTCITLPQQLTDPTSQTQLATLPTKPSLGQAPLISLSPAQLPLSPPKSKRPKLSQKTSHSKKKQSIKKSLPKLPLNELESLSIIHKHQKVFTLPQQLIQPVDPPSQTPLISDTLPVDPPSQTPLISDTLPVDPPSQTPLISDTLPVDPPSQTPLISDTLPRELLVPVTEQSQTYDWLPDLYLSHHEKSILQSDEWLNNAIIYAAQLLLRNQTKGEIFGWQSPLCSIAQSFQFKHISSKSKFVQILHVSNCHWVTTSNIDTRNGIPYSNSICIYDSGRPKNVKPSLKQEICKFYKSVASSVFFDIINVEGQPNAYDCGVYAIAYATELAHGLNPALIKWKSGCLRNHIISCFENGQMTRFPSVGKKRITLPCTIIVM